MTMEPVLSFRKANCKDCYKCVRNCPIKAIEVRERQARIIDRECVLCGKCTLVCPQNAKRVRDDVPLAKNLIRSGKKVYACVAPSYIACFPVGSFSDFENGLLALGFSGAYEAAEGAYLVKSEYERLLQGRKAPLISSCCPTVVRLVERHYPEALPALAAVLSPMQASAKLIKARHPGCAVVFIGPCISKKAECEGEPGYAECALTFDELGAWMRERGEAFLQRDAEEQEKRLSRFFPVCGGILDTMSKREGVAYVAVDGLEGCISALREVAAGGLENCFIEMSACEGSCVMGPANGGGAGEVLSRIRVGGAAGDGSADFTPAEQVELTLAHKKDRVLTAQPSGAEIAAILRKMGKEAMEDELNCGACGYDSCREKAIAVYFGKAETEMCLPYMRARAESISDNIISSSPNAIVVADDDFNIQLINEAACELFSVKAQDAKGGPVSRFLDDMDFAEALQSGEKLEKKVYLAEYGKYIEQTFVRANGASLVICIMKDATAREKKRAEIAEAKRRAAETTDGIVEKQMRIVHEIASLLGETTADTKIALSELKNTILLEEDG